MVKALTHANQKEWKISHKDLRFEQQHSRRRTNKALTLKRFYPPKSERHITLISGINN